MILVKFIIKSSHCSATATETNELFLLTNEVSPLASEVGR